MGRVLGGGSSVNVMIWARGHKNDWVSLLLRLAKTLGTISQY
jgi:choline dehydrogenase-like flavoprotein